MKLKKALAAVLSAAMIVTSLPAAAFAEEDVSLPAVVEEEQLDGEEEAHSHTFGAWNYDEENDVFVKECADCGETQQEEMPVDVKALLDKIDADTAEDTLDAAVEDGFLTAAAAAYILSNVEAEEPATVVDGGEINLEYDDYYIKIDFDGAEVTDETVTSNQVKVEKTDNSYENTLGETKDEHVVEVTKDGELHAVGIGTATVTVGDTAYTVTVEPATLSLFLLGGQSNMEGAEGNKAQSIANENGTVYASYGRNSLLVEENGASFIPSTLSGTNRTVSVDEATNKSQSTLKGFPVYSLTEEGSGREGMDSAIAYAWHKETGDKVWIVNASHSGSSIQTWQPDNSYDGINDNYSSAVAMFRAAEEVYKAEIEAGHYKLGNVGMFWHQGCSNRGNTAKQYTDYFTNMYKAFKHEFAITIDEEDVNLEFADIALVRYGYNTEDCMKSSDLEMTGPRISQYWMGNNTGKYNGVDLSEINLVCNISDLWVYDEDNLPATVGKYDTVGEFFQSRYPNGKVNYPAQTTDDSWRTPTTPADMHDSIHYNQVGYNEIGLESARNAVKILNGEKTNDVSVSFVSKDGYKPLSESVTIGKNEPSKVVVPIVEPLYMAPYVSITDGATEESFYTYTGNTEIAVSYKGDELGKVSVGKDEKTSYVKYLWKADTVSGNLENSTDFGSAANAATLKNGSTEFAGKQTGTVYSLDENIVLSHDKNWSVEWKQDGMVKGMLLANEMKTTADSRYIWLNGSSVQVNVGATSNRYLQYGIKVSSESGIYKLVNTYNEETGKNTITLYKDGVEVGPLTTRYVNGSPTTDLDGSSKIDVPVVNEDGTNGLDMTFCQIGKDGSESFKMTGGIGYIQVNEDGAINNAAVQFTTDIADGKHATGAELSVAATAGEGNAVTYQWYKTNANGTKGTLIADATDASYTPTAGGYYVCVAKTTASPDYALSKIAYVSEAGHTTSDIYLWDFTDGSLETKDNNNTLTPISYSDKLKLENGTYTSYEEYLNDKGETAYYYVRSKITDPIRLEHDKNWVVEYKADMKPIGSGMFLLSGSDTSISEGNNYIWLNNGIKIGQAVKNENGSAYINYGKTISGFNASGTTQTVTIKNVYDETTDTRHIDVYVDGERKAPNILENVGVGGDDNKKVIPDANRNREYLDNLTGIQDADFVFGYMGASGFSGIKDLDYLYINTDTAVDYDKAKDLMAEITTEANTYVVGSADDVKPIVVKADAANADTTTPAFTYQWYKDNVKLENETNNTLTPDVATKGLSTYKCEVTYNGATVTTGTVKIKVTEENAPVDFEWNFNDFTNKTFTSTNGNTMKEVLYKDNQERLSNSNGRFVGKSVTVTGETTNVGAVAEMAQSFDLKMNENWTLEWKGTLTGGMILSGSKKSQSEGNYYIWKTGNTLYVGVGAKTSAGDVTNYRNLGKVTMDSTEHVVQIRNYYDTNQNTISILIDGIVATTDITTVGNTGGSSALTEAQLAYVKEHYFSPANTMTFQYMGVAPSFGVVGNIDYLKVYYSDPCKHANVSADWKYDKKAYWKVCEDCQTILEYTPYVEGETLMKHSAKTATCATNGNVAYSEYWVGGTKDNGGTVHYFYDDKGLTSEITDLTKTVLPMKGHKYGDWVVTVSEDGAYTLTHTCTVCDEAEDGHTETFKNVTLDAIAVSGTYKTDYAVGDTVNTDGMVVKAAFKYDDNGVEKTAVAEVSGFDATLDTTTAGTKNITVTYGGQTATAEVTVAKGAYPLTLTADKTSMKGRGIVTLTVEGVPTGAKGTLNITCDDATIEVTHTASEDGKEVFTASLPNATKEYTFTVAANDFITANYEEGTASCTVNVTRKKSSSSSDTSAPTYGVSTGKTENGKLTVDPANAAAGEKVTITAKPDSGYQLDKITVKDKNNSNVKLTKVDDNEYTFTMPSGKVSVDATFVPKDTKDDNQNNNTETKGNPFVDVKASDWFYGSVLKAYETGWMSGTSAVTFAPNASTTRGMIVSVLYRLEGSPEAGDSTFTDVKAGAYYAKAVAWAAENSIVGGYGNGTFGPNDEITREQLAAILYRYAQFKGYDVSKKADLTAYSDYAQVSAYAKDAVAWANAAGILSGTSATTLSPRDHATRAQVAAILVRFTDAFQA